MKPRIFHGEIYPFDIAKALIGEFNRGNLVARHTGSKNNIVVQIFTREQRQSGGQTAISLAIRQVEDGVAISLGKQDLLGLAASIGKTALYTLRNPWNIIGRLDDIAQDIDHLQLADEIWEVIEDTAQSLDATFELSERLRRTVCPYCQSANKIGESNCIACGAPLGKQQLGTCSNCGFVIKPVEKECPNCGEPVKI